jgi:predicted ATP-grasp superfamily ATP-dependent carboligase
LEEVTYEELDIANAVIIGYMMGTYHVIGRGGAQAVANMAGEVAGRELVRYAESRSLPLETWEDVRDFLIGAGLTGFIEFEWTEDGRDVEIRDCRICPKRVGHYEFPGTACPWGGLLSGILGHVLNERYTSTPRLTPAETCVVQLVRK